MPRISTNPLTTEGVPVAKMSNLQMDHMVGMEEQELMGEDGNLEENGNSDNLLRYSACCDVLEISEEDLQSKDLTNGGKVERFTELDGGQD